MCDSAILKDIFEILVEPAKPLAYVVRGNGILNFHHDDDYIHEIQGDVIDWTFVVQFLVQLHLIVPCVDIETRDDDGIEETAQRQKDCVSPDLLR